MWGAWGCLSGGGWTCISGTAVPAKNASTDRLRLCPWASSFTEPSKSWIFRMLPASGRRLFIISDLSKEINYLTGEWRVLTYAGEKMSTPIYTWGTLSYHGDRSHLTAHIVHLPRGTRGGRGTSAGFLCPSARGDGCSRGSLSGVTLTAKEDLSQLLL